MREEGYEGIEDVARGVVVIALCVIEYQVSATYISFGPITLCTNHGCPVLIPIVQCWRISLVNSMTESLRGRVDGIARDRSENRRGRLPSGFTGVHLLRFWAFRRCSIHRANLNALSSSVILVKENTLAGFRVAISGRPASSAEYSSARMKRALEPSEGLT